METGDGQFVRADRADRDDVVSHGIVALPVGGADAGRRPARNPGRSGLPRVGTVRLLQNLEQATITELGRELALAVGLVDLEGG